MKFIWVVINWYLFDIGWNINIVNDKVFKVVNKGFIGFLKWRMVIGIFCLIIYKEVIDVFDL